MLRLSAKAVVELKHNDIVTGIITEESLDVEAQTSTEEVNQDPLNYH